MTASLRERLGLPSEGLALFTCPTCGCHTAGPPPVACWACGALPRLTRRLARVVVLPGGVVWRVLATHTGWSATCVCGRTLHQWTEKEPRPSHVQCPNTACGKWTVAP